MGCPTDMAGDVEQPPLVTARRDMVAKVCRPSKDPHKRLNENKFHDGSPGNQNRNNQSTSRPSLTWHTCLSWSANSLSRKKRRVAVWVKSPAQCMTQRNLGHTVPRAD